MLTLIPHAASGFLFDDGLAEHLVLLLPRLEQLGGSLHGDLELRVLQEHDLLSLEDLGDLDGEVSRQGLNQLHGSLGLVVLDGGQLLHMREDLHHGLLEFLHVGGGQQLVDGELLHEGVAIDTPQ